MVVQPVNFLWLLKNSRNGPSSVARSVHFHSSQLTGSVFLGRSLLCPTDFANTIFKRMSGSGNLLPTADVIAPAASIGGVFSRIGAGWGLGSLGFVRLAACGDLPSAH